MTDTKRGPGRPPKFGKKMVRIQSRVPLVDRMWLIKQPGEGSLTKGLRRLISFGRWAWKQPELQARMIARDCDGDGTGTS